MKEEEKDTIIINRILLALKEQQEVKIYYLNIII